MFLILQIFQQTSFFQDYESLNEHSEQKIQSVEQPSEVRSFETFQPTNISSDKSDNPSDSAFNDSFLESPPAGPSEAPVTPSENLSFERLSLGGPNPSATSNPGFQGDKQSLHKTVQKYAPTLHDSWSTLTDINKVNMMLGGNSQH